MHVELRYAIFLSFGFFLLEGRGITKEDVMM
jgi:hypothetical protein